ncbi:MAG: nicotinate-nucleotide--dimethylbenzimidazole phosphoribosyltransferase [Porphyromonas sp.]|nr:nicotinate-nucleotide--dimethylbenzimidazole phosphoribosyltransferase [Porphyromonas sp.]
MITKEQLQHKIDTRTKIVGSLGKLEDLALQIGMIQQTLTPELRNPAILVFASDHGIADEGVSVCPKEITWQMAMNFVRGGAGISVFSKQHDIRLRVIDVGVDYDFPKGIAVENRKIAYGSKNMLREPAMTIEECKKAMAIGAECVREEFGRGCNVIGFGEMGIANTSPSTLLLHHFAGTPLEVCTGRGAGLDKKGVNHKLDILTQVYAKYDPKTPLEALATLGGFEIAAICGGVLEAKKLGMLIIADGFITSAGFLVAYEMDRSIISNVVFSHASEEPGHKAMVEYMHGDPILHLGLRLGEGTGCAIVYPILQSALVFLNNMASFEEAGVYEVGSI